VPHHRAGEIDVADLAPPAVVFRHVGVALEGAEPAQHPDAPAGLLEALAVERVQRALAGVDAAARQLELAARRGLLGDEHVAAVADHRIGAGPLAVGLSRVHRLAEASHGAAL
jgi:hypothetical protein